MSNRGSILLLAQSWLPLNYLQTKNADGKIASKNLSTSALIFLGS
jgi:hypothetical protein